MADLRDFTGKNRKFTGTIGERISIGTTGERDTSTFGAGTIRFNSSTLLMEYYTGTEWKSIDAPPSITNFTINGGAPTTSGNLIQASSNATIVINGSLFDTISATVLFLGTGGGDVSPLTTVRNSSNQITVTVNTSLFSDTYEPYDIKVTNGSGLSATLENCITSNAAPAFITASGTLGTIANGARSSYTLSTAAATDSDGDTITYSITAGSLPTGLSLNASTAAITGTASAVGSNTTSTFTVTAATTGQSSSRQFSITVNAPVITTFNSPGTFTVPVGLTSVDVLVVAGGGGAGGFGGGGAGGLIYRPGFPITPGTPIAVTIGQGGAGTGGNPAPPSEPGQDSVFSTLTAKGGGGGGQSPLGGPPNENTGDGAPGGSGGGGGHPNSTSIGSPDGVGGTATQPTQPGDSGSYGFGNAGGQGNNTLPSNDPQPVSTAGGGGGAGAVGGQGQAQRSDEHGGAGGIGKAYDISGTSVYYAGGGGGSYGGQGSQGGGGPAENTSNAVNGTANTGGGGSSIKSGAPGARGSGGSGVIIVSS